MQVDEVIATYMHPRDIKRQALWAGWIPDLFLPFKSPSRTYHLEWTHAYEQPQVGDKYDDCKSLGDVKGKMDLSSLGSTYSY